jgi:hypothetical protein
MNKYIFTIALSICATLSSMEQTHKLTILVPSPRKLHITFRKKGYGVWAEETKIPEIIGNKHLLKASLISYIRIALREHNNLYSPEDLTKETNNIMHIINSIIITDLKTSKKLSLVSKI